MTEKTKAVDCLILCPKARTTAGQEGIEAEQSAGRGGILGLFPGVAKRFARGASQDELVVSMNEASVEKDMISIHDDADKEWVLEVMKKYPGRFLPRLRINPGENGIMDELHFYRGRQGANVAMLLRRVQQRAGHDLQVIGTSATMTTQGTRDERRQAVADVGTRLFGVTVQAKNVVDETLQRVAKVPVSANQDELRQAVEMEPPAPTVEAVTNHPLSAWLEEAFGLASEEGRLVRREPETFANAVVRLATETGLDREFCAQRLRAVLDAGNQAYLIPGQPIFAFRLHQFLSSGSSVYATLESPEARHLTMEGQYKADEERVLFPLAFCRECGQEYYLVSRIEEEGKQKLIPRSPLVGASDEDIPGQSGFLPLRMASFGRGKMMNFRSSGLTNCVADGVSSQGILNIVLPDIAPLLTAR